VKKLTKEYMIASVSLVESDLQDEIFKTLYDYILNQWNQSIVNEYNLLCNAKIVDIKNLDKKVEDKPQLFSAS
jgi:hypothetical protein